MPNPASVLEDPDQIPPTQDFRFPLCGLMCSTRSTLVLSDGLMFVSSMDRSVQKAIPPPASLADAGGGQGQGSPLQGACKLVGTGFAGWSHPELRAAGKQLPTDSTVSTSGPSSPSPPHSFCFSTSRSSLHLLQLLPVPPLKLPSSQPQWPCSRLILLGPSVAPKTRVLWSQLGRRWS